LKLFSGPIKGLIPEEDSENEEMPIVMKGLKGFLKKCESPQKTTKPGTGTSSTRVSENHKKRKLHEITKPAASEKKTVATRIDSFFGKKSTEKATTPVTPVKGVVEKSATKKRKLNE